MELLKLLSNNRIFIVLVIAILCEIAAASLNKWLKTQSLSDADKLTFKICISLTIATLAALILIKLFAKDINVYIIYSLMVISVISGAIITVKLYNNPAAKGDSYALNITGYVATFGALLLLGLDKQSF